MSTKKLTIYDMAGNALARARKRWDGLESTQEKRAYRIGWIDGRAAARREDKAKKAKVSK